MESKSNHSIYHPSPLSALALHSLADFCEFSRHENQSHPRCFHNSDWNFEYFAGMGNVEAHSRPKAAAWVSKYVNSVQLLQLSLSYFKLDVTPFI